jgi:hypothetical protein
MDAFITVGALAPKRLSRKAVGGNGPYLLPSNQMPNRQRPKKSQGSNSIQGFETWPLGFVWNLAPEIWNFLPCSR